jgi:hypothetical protein
VLFAVPIALLAGTVAFYFNGQTVPSDMGATSTIVAPAPEVRAAGWDPLQSPGPASSTAVSAKIMNVSVAQPMPAGTVMEGTVSSVTHTRAGPVATSVAASASEPSSEKPAGPGVVPAPIVAAPSYSRVTHTKAHAPAVRPASAAAAFAAVESLPPEQSLDSREEQLAGCAPGVAALGLCINQ